jgi:putative transposase
MAASLKLLPGSTVRWRGRRYLIVDYESLDAIIARQPGKRRLERIPVNEAAPDHASHIVSAWTPDLASVPEEAWQKAVKRFKILKPLLNMGNSERTFAHIKKAARALGKHPATVYRWIENYGRSERLSVFLRKERSDRGARRLSNKVEKIIDAAIKKIYLTAERPDVAAVVEEVNLQCFNSKIKGKPAPNTIRARVSVLSDRLKLEKREGRKRAAEKYEPLKGHFPGADCPLAVAQIDHTPMDVIVVDEEHRQPIQRPSLTVVIDVYSRMVLGFAIYLEKPSAFTAGLAIAHAVLPKEHWLADVGVQAEWPCWGKMRTIHCDNEGVSRHSDRPGLPGSRYRHRSPPAARTALWRSYRTRVRDLVNPGSSAQRYNIFQCRTEGRLRFGRPCHHDPRRTGKMVHDLRRQGLRQYVS